MTLTSLPATGAGIALPDLVDYLDQYLRIREVGDSPNAVNGLEVENSGRIGRLIAAVDASQETIDGVVDSISRSGDAGPPLLLVHHGLFWDGNIPVVGRRYRRLKALLSHDIALYAAHIPLDLHSEVGNNVVLAGMLELATAGMFGRHLGQEIGVWGTWRDGGALPRESLVSRLDDLLETQAMLIPGGPAECTRVGVLTGAGGSAIADAHAAGLDTLVTGEGAHHTYFDAMEWGINVIYAGHYATEQVGVRALAEHLGSRFGLPWEFHRHPTGL
ncbi:MAG TPA: Nif3-like dinuclear metal center hexameric protein [Gemmatimonadales bacterium]|nr:Nif3-like dinuclear metal center hexameric protein [Gemmatimonadales bacterium]